MKEEDCIQCGKCCYNEEGQPCKYLSNTQKCQIYNVRLMAQDGNGGFCGTNMCKIFKSP